MSKWSCRQIIRTHIIIICCVLSGLSKSATGAAAAALYAQKDENAKAFCPVHIYCTQYANVLGRNLVYTFSKHSSEKNENVLLNTLNVVVYNVGI